MFAAPRVRGTRYYCPPIAEGYKDEIESAGDDMSEIVDELESLEGSIEDEDDDCRMDLDQDDDLTIHICATPTGHARWKQIRRPS